MPPRKGLGGNGSHLGEGDNSEVGVGVEPSRDEREKDVKHDYIIAVN